MVDPTEVWVQQVFGIYIRMYRHLMRQLYVIYILFYIYGISLEHSLRGFLSNTSVYLSNSPVQFIVLRFLYVFFFLQIDLFN